MSDAFLAAFRVGLEGAIAAALAWALLRGGPLRKLAAPFAAAVAGGLAVGVGIAWTAAARGLSARDLAPQLHRTEHLFAVGLAGLVLLARGRSAEGLAEGRGRLGVEAVALAVGLLVLLPEGAFLAGHLRDAAILGGAAAPIALGAAGGLALAAAAGGLAAFLWARAGAGRFLSPAAVLALLLALEIAGVAAGAVEAHTLPRALAGWTSRSVHDAVHLLFVVMQVPDHAFLEEWAYQLILKFLEPAVHAALAALAVAAPIAVAARAFLRRPAPVVDAAARAPERRVARARFLRASRLGAASFAAALVISSAAIWSAAAGTEELYEPIPEPVVDDGGGSIVVPLGGPLAGGDDRMRKWVYAAGRHAVTFFTIRRPDGSLAVALDLCEICQPKGYAQMGTGYVFCKYCKTPIPVVTVGQPGGCNPIPVRGATLRGSVLLLPRDAVVRAWETAMAGKR